MIDATPNDDNPLACLRGVVTGRAGWALFRSTNDDLHRFALYRPIAPLLGGRVLVSCGLNPSIADERQDDPTIRKEIGFAKRWNLHHYVKVNASSIVATDPKHMKIARKTGRDNLDANDDWIRAAIALAIETDGIFLAAWGQNITPERQAQIAEMLREAGARSMCLGINQDGSAEHPLYVPYVRPLVEWSSP
jgi:hypothetical protein